MWLLQGLVTAGNIRGGGESGSDNGGGWVFRLSLKRSQKGRVLPKLKNCKQEAKQVKI